jgi:hypothetical protein
LQQQQQQQEEKAEFGYKQYMATQNKTNNNYMQSSTRTSNELHAQELFNESDKRDSRVIRCRQLVDPSFRCRNDTKSRAKQKSQTTLHSSESSSSSSSSSSDDDAANIPSSVASTPTEKRPSRSSLHSRASSTTSNNKSQVAAPRNARPKRTAAVAVTSSSHKRNKKRNTYDADDDYVPDNCDSDMSEEESEEETSESYVSEADPAVGVVRDNDVGTAEESSDDENDKVPPYQSPQLEFKSSPKRRKRAADFTEESKEGKASHRASQVETRSSPKRRKQPAKENDYFAEESSDDAETNKAVPRGAKNAPHDCDDSSSASDDESEGPRMPHCPSAEDAITAEQLPTKHVRLFFISYSSVSLNSAERSLAVSFSFCRFVIVARIKVRVSALPWKRCGRLHS